MGSVKWNRYGWPVVNGCGNMQEYVCLDASVEDSDDFLDEYKSEILQLDYSHVRNPNSELYQVANGSLTLTGRERLRSKNTSPTFLGIRQKQFRAEAKVCISIQEDSLAGITAYYNDEHHYALCILRQNNHVRIILRKHIYDLEVETAEAESNKDLLWLRIRANEDSYVFEFSEGDDHWIYLGEGAVAALCTEVTRTMSFTGTFLGLFCEYGQASFSMFSVRYPKD